MNTEKTNSEEFRVEGEKLVAEVKKLIKAGNVRKVIIKNPEGHVFLEIPLTIGVVGAALLPVWVALGAIAALAMSYTIVVERVVGEPGAETEPHSEENG